MFKWVLKRICHVSVSHLVERVTSVLRGKLTPILCSFKLFLSFQLTHQLAGTPIRCFAHAHACSLTHVEADLPAKTVVLSQQTPE